MLPNRFCGKSGRRTDKQTTTLLLQLEREVHRFADHWNLDCSIMPVKLKGKDGKQIRVQRHCSAVAVEIPISAIKGIWFALLFIIFFL